jgi:cell division protein ZapA (FtsZ GTPase activity inhibitor)
MTPTEYWLKEIRKANELAPNSTTLDKPDPQMVAALLIAGQLQSIVGRLEEIRAQLDHIEDQIANQ